MARRQSSEGGEKKRGAGVRPGEMTSNVEREREKGEDNNNKAERERNI